MKLENINPYIRVAMRSVLPKHFKIAPRIIYDYELIYIENGTFLFNYNGVDYNVSKGQYIFIRPDTVHSFTCSDTELSQPHIHFDFCYNDKSEETPVCYKLKEDLTSKEKGYITKNIFFSFENTPFVTFKDEEKFKALFYPIVDNTYCLSTLEKKANLLKIIDMLITDNFPDTFDDTNATNSCIARQIKDSIDSLQRLDSSLSDFEKIYNYSRFTLEKQFKKQYGESIISYRNKKRMEYAKKLLVDNSVSQTAFLCGFNSIYSFSRAFKDYYGISPRDIK